VQTERVLHTLLARYPVWDVDTRDVTWQSESLILRGPAGLPCRFSAVPIDVDEALASGGVDE
jgi:hypothetical protein